MTTSLLRYLRDHHLALVALLLAMGGTAYAVDNIKGRDVAKGSLKGKHLKNESIQGRDIEDGSLNGSHIDESTLDDPAPSATVAGEGVPKFLQQNGFTEVRRSGPGIYELSLRDPQACNFAGSFYGLDEAETGDGGSIAVAYAPGEGEFGLTVVLRDHAGDLVDLGTGNGPFGFTLVSGC